MKHSFAHSHRRNHVAPILEHSGNRLLYICITSFYSSAARRYDGWEDVSTFSPTEG